MTTEFDSRTSAKRERNRSGASLTTMRTRGFLVHQSIDCGSDMRIFMTIVLMIANVIFFASCSSGHTILEWREEVRLEDGRVVVIDQKRNCEPGYTGHGGQQDDCLSRESWVTLNMPEFGASPILWHEHLAPLVVNVHAGKLYIVGRPPTDREKQLYGNPRPSYIGFVWENGEWTRISFDRIPTEIYETNVLVGSVPSDDTYISVSRKYTDESGMLEDPMTVPFLKRIDPASR